MCLLPAAGRRGAGRPPVSPSCLGSEPSGLYSSPHPSCLTAAPCSSSLVSYSETPLPVHRRRFVNEDNKEPISVCVCVGVCVDELRWRGRTCSVARLRTSSPIFRSIRSRSASSCRLKRMLLTTSSLRRSSSASSLMSPSPRSRR